MKKKLLLAAAALVMYFAANAQNKYVYDIDLQNVENDRVKITLTPPDIKKRKAVYVMPGVIPGSYARKDYGRFITNFKAFGANNKALKVTKKDVNRFVINKARQLERIEYWVNDTWDDENIDQFVFQSGGSNIEAGKNYSINHHAFFGYLNGMKMLPFELHFSKPAGFYGATALKGRQINPARDVFTAPNYVKLVDNPVLYCLPDTTSFTVRNAVVQVAVYSPNKIVQSAKVAAYLQPLANALGNFFGSFPVSNYHFLFYFADPNIKLPETKGLGGYGALEHSYCSFYYLPEMENETALKSMIQDVCGHEFLHILTPLNIHSEQIENFNFVNPDMSQHLWLYEGVTEYFAMLVQLRAGLITPDEFQTKIRNKIAHADAFPAMSFTQMSRNIINDEYQDDYLNVYQKGALIGFCLDLYLTRHSNGRYGLRELMLDLSKKYGPNKPFKDDRLFNDIAELTTHNVLNFFETYVQGDEPLPFAGLFDIIGWRYSERENVDGYYFGSFGLGFNAEDAALQFIDVGQNVLGIEENDRLLKVNDTEVTIGNAREVLEPLFGAANRQNITLTVMRNGTIMELTGQPQLQTRIMQHVVESVARPTPEQLRLRNFLFTGKTGEGQ
ncbi:peptidase M61 [Sphingobacteriales bacterium UPWRP_1]|nr:hypothetical protein BVG80_13965 [Sphingobacteriales bacterium TSM_CSM]PSJ77087.1 peptidase M61 [Sphingobacteriales bacterium UPWRP_1]